MILRKIKKTNKRLICIRAKGFKNLKLKQSKVVNFRKFSFIPFGKEGYEKKK